MADGGGLAGRLADVPATVRRVHEAAQTFWARMTRRHEDLVLENQLLRARVRALESSRDRPASGDPELERAIYGSLGRRPSEATKLAHLEDKIAVVVRAMRDVGLPEGVTVDQFAFWFQDQVVAVRHRTEGA